MHESARKEKKINKALFQCASSFYICGQTPTPKLMRFSRENLSQNKNCPNLNWMVAAPVITKQYCGVGQGMVLTPPNARVTKSMQKSQNKNLTMSLCRVGESYMYRPIYIYIPNIQNPRKWTVFYLWKTIKNLQVIHRSEWKHKGSGCRHQSPLEMYILKKKQQKNVFTKSDSIVLPSCRAGIFLFLFHQLSWLVPGVFFPGGGCSYRSSTSGIFSLQKFECSDQKSMDRNLHSQIWQKQNKIKQTNKRKEDQDELSEGTFCDPNRAGYPNQAISDF